MSGEPNLLYYGDNLDVLQRYVATSPSISSILTRRSSRTRTTTCCSRNMATGSAAQIKAFEDTWNGTFSPAAYEEVVESGGGQVRWPMQAFRTVLGDNDMLAYLSMMAPRLVELRRVLKSTGSCISTATRPPATT